MIHRYTHLLLFTGASIALSINTPAQPPAPQPLTFEVATIKPTVRTDGAWRLQSTPDGYTGMDVSLLKLAAEAYGISDPKLITGGPSWIDTDKFDLEAKFDTTSIPNAKDLTYRQRADMLQPLLAERFHLKVHYETRDFPTYNLVVAKGGPKLIETKSEDIRTGPTGAPICLGGQNARTLIYTGVGCRTIDLERLLRSAAGRTVIDKTGLTARYSLELHWTPDDTPANSSRAGGPSIFTALQEQLGLKLEPSTAALNVLVIDSAEKPSGN
jgi:uncharacterized protein (TIGR03435 family)